MLVNLKGQYMVAKTSVFLHTGYRSNNIGEDPGISTTLMRACYGLYHVVQGARYQEAC